MRVSSFDMTTIRDLDESIDTLCEFFGEEEQDNSLAEQYCPYFGVLWESGVGLSQHLRELNLTGKKVVEIGCGLALPSFAVTRLGAEVIATDFHDDVPLFLEHNQKANNVFFPYFKMNWREGLEEFKAKFGSFDLVIGSDILYEGQHPNQVARALISLLKPQGQMILSDPGRAYIQKFISAMKDLGYQEIMSIEKVRAELTPKNKERDVFVFTFNG